MPDWLVTMNSLKPASASCFSAGAGPGKNFHVLGPVQIVFFRDQRAIAVQKNGAIHSGKLWSDYGKNGIEFFAVCSIIDLISVVQRQLNNQ